MFGKFKYPILLHLIILIWGFTGILGKLIELDAFYIVWHRVVIASLSLFIAMLFLKKSFSVVSKKRLIQICITGVIVGLHWITFYQSIQLSTASLGILCLSTTSIHVAWLEPLIMKRSFSWVELVLSALVVYGIYFVSSDFSSTDFIALAYGLFSALLAAVFSVFNAKFTESIPPSTITLYEMAAASLFLSLVLVFQGRFTLELFNMTLS
ncbi:MAG: EamA family transporter, partial [Crocinitomicaceae bacterium]|nr:EamA family transporter [Crocinitomicaceae bacterium]